MVWEIKTDAINKELVLIVDSKIVGRIFLIYGRAYVAKVGPIPKGEDGILKLKKFNLSQEQIQKSLIIKVFPAIPYTIEGWIHPNDRPLEEHSGRRKRRYRGMGRDVLRRAIRRRQNSRRGEGKV